MDRGVWERLDPVPTPPPAYSPYSHRGRAKQPRRVRQNQHKAIYLINSTATNSTTSLSEHHYRTEKIVLQRDLPGGQQSVLITDHICKILKYSKLPCSKLSNQVLCCCSGFQMTTQTFSLLGAGGEKSLHKPQRQG